jgi:hypothetical protein
MCRIGRAVEMFKFDQLRSCPNQMYSIVSDGRTNLAIRSMRFDLPQFVLCSTSRRCQGEVASCFRRNLHRDLMRAARMLLESLSTNPVFTKRFIGHVAQAGKKSFVSTIVGVLLAPVHSSDHGSRVQSKRQTMCSCS